MLWILGELRLDLVPAISGGMVVAIAGLILVGGWGLDIAVLRSLGTGHAMMYPVTAVLLMLLGASLILDAVRGGVAETIGAICAGTGLLSAAMMLAAKAAAIDQLLAVRLPAFATVLGLLIVAVAVLLLLRAPGRAGGVIASLGLTGLLLPLFRLLDLMLGQGSSVFESMAPSTALLLALLAGGVLAHRSLPFMSLLGSRTIQGSVLRLAVPWTTLVPMLLAVVVAQAVAGGSLAPDLAFAVLAASIGTVTTTLIWVHAVQLGKIDLVRSRQLRELRGRERAANDLLNSLPEVVVHAHPDTAIRFVNQRYHQLFGTSEEAIRGHSFLAQMPASEIGRIEGILGWLTPESPVETMELVMPEPRAHRQVLLWSWRMRYDAAGRPLDLIATAWDATVLADARRRHAAELEVLRDLAAIAHHDLEQGIRQLATAANLLESGLGEAGTREVSAQVAVVAAGVRRLRRLTGPARPHPANSDAAMPRERLAVAAIVAEAVTALDAELRDVGAEVELGGGLPIVLGQRARLVALFRSLLGNALELCAHPPRRILIEARRGTRAHEIFVLAMGQRDSVERLTTLFGRAEPEHGLAAGEIGLRLCRRMAQELGGSLGLVDTRADGVGFRLTLIDELAVRREDEQPADAA